MTGYIADVRAYTRVLTQAEIVLIYGAPTTSDVSYAVTRPGGTVSASASGIANDADCATGAKVGGGTATDNTQKLNVLLMSAASTNALDLLLDGPGCAFVSGLFLPAGGNVTVRGSGWQNGVFVKSGSNAAAFDTGFGQDPKAPRRPKGRRSRCGICRSTAIVERILAVTRPLGTITACHGSYAWLPTIWTTSPWRTCGCMTAPRTLS